MNKKNKYINGGKLSDALGLFSAIQEVDSAVGQALTDGYSNNVGNALQSIPGLGIVGGLVNRAFGTRENEALHNIVNQEENYLRNFESSASDLDNLIGPNATSFNTDVYKGGWTKSSRRKARTKNNTLMADLVSASDYAQQNVQNNATNILQDQESNLLSQMFAEGGPIHIKESKKGTFTAAAKKHGKSVQAFASQVLANKDNYSPAMVKKANFARNSVKWHKNGGFLEDFTNGLSFINEGGSHDTNPNEGIQVGIDENGIPDLVEQGEIIYDNYVFSDRLKVPKNLRDKYKIKKGATYAEGVKKVQKESSNRPNDPISKNGLNAALKDFIASQENQRGTDSTSNKHYKGSYIHDWDATSVPERWNDIMPEIILNKPVTQRNDFPKIDNQFERSLKASEFTMPGTTTNSLGDTKKSKWLENLRYVSPIAQGATVFADMFSKPDYSASEAMMSIPIRTPKVKSSPVGQKLTYKPVDTNSQLNAINSALGAVNRSIADQSGGNRGTAIAGMTAAINNATNSIGEALRQAENTNFDRRAAIADFNSKIDMYNTDQALKAAMANAQSEQELQRLRTSLINDALRIREAERAAYNARRSNNINNFLNSLTALGQEFTQREWLDNLAKKGVLKIDTKGNYIGG